MPDRVSVIIPCYRDAATLGRALDSVYAQTRRVDEVVVVNDCSPESEEIEAVLRGYAHVTYIRNSRNVGLAASRNIGVHVATGEILSFLDADDELHPQKVEFQLNVFRPDIVVACRVRRIKADSSRTEAAPYGKDFRAIEVTSSRAIIWRNCLTGASIMISRELLLHFGGYDEALRSCEDYDLWLRLLDAGIAVYNIQLPLYLYRYNNHGLSRNYLNISFFELQVLRKYFQRQDREFLAATLDARTWAFWLIKHMIRFELCLNNELRIATRRNIKFLSAHPVLAESLLFSERIRLFRPVRMLAALRSEWIIRKPEGEDD